MLVLLLRLFLDRCPYETSFILRPALDPLSTHSHPAGVELLDRIFELDPRALPELWRRAEDHRGGPEGASRAHPRTSGSARPVALLARSYSWRGGTMLARPAALCGLSAFRARCCSRHGKPARRLSGADTRRCRDSASCGMVALPCGVHDLSGQLYAAAVTTLGSITCTTLAGRLASGPLRMKPKGLPSGSRVRPKKLFRNTAPAQ